MTLYHYCCRHSAQQITRRGFLRPHGQELFDVGLVWLTDQAVPDRVGLGLTSHLLKCDRLEYQYVVKTEEAEPWLASDVGARLATEDGFHEFEDGRRPETWWIARSPVFAIQNRAYAPPVARIEDGPLARHL